MTDTHYFIPKNSIKKNSGENPNFEEEPDFCDLLITNLPKEFKTQKFKTKIKTFFQRKVIFEFKVIKIEAQVHSEVLQESLAILKIAKGLAKELLTWDCYFGNKSPKFQILSADASEQYYNKRLVMVEGIFGDAEDNEVKERNLFRVFSKHFLVQSIHFFDREGGVYLGQGGIPPEAQLWIKRVTAGKGCPVDRVVMVAENHFDFEKLCKYVKEFTDWKVWRLRYKDTRIEEDSKAEPRNKRVQDEYRTSFSKLGNARDHPRPRDHDFHQNPQRIAALQPVSHFRNSERIYNQDGHRRGTYNRSLLEWRDTPNMMSNQPGAPRNWAPPAENVYTPPERRRGLGSRQVITPARQDRRMENSHNQRWNFDYLGKDKQNILKILDVTRFVKGNHSHWNLRMNLKQPDKTK